MQSTLIDSWSASIRIWFSPHRCILAKEWASFGTLIRSLSLKMLEMQSSHRGRRWRRRFRFLPWLRHPRLRSGRRRFIVRAAMLVQTALEISVERAAATRKAIAGGDPWGLPAAGVVDSSGAGRRDERD
jgi:hypothetical protein